MKFVPSTAFALVLSVGVQAKNLMKSMEQDNLESQKSYQSVMKSKSSNLEVQEAYKKEVNRIISEMDEKESWTEQDKLELAQKLRKLQEQDKLQAMQLDAQDDKFGFHEIFASKDTDFIELYRKIYSGEDLPKYCENNISDDAFKNKSSQEQSDYIGCLMNHQYSLQSGLAEIKKVERAVKLLIQKAPDNVTDLVMSHNQCINIIQVTLKFRFESMFPKIGTYFDDRQSSESIYKDLKSTLKMIKDRLD